MYCSVLGLGHRYGSKYLFKGLTFNILTGSLCTLKGNNGTGKSTLLKILTGAMEPVEGEIFYEHNGIKLDQDQLWKMIGMVAPYQELPEELSLMELILFQVDMVPNAGLLNSYLQTADGFGLTPFLKMQISQFSTGMKQKARIVLGMTLGRPIWILDEPTSNLDANAHAYFWSLISAERKNKLILVASNDASDWAYADWFLDLNASSPQ